MDRVTKNAPFGTDNTPNLEYKIVGGKRVEVLAKNISEESSQKSKLSFNSPKLGPHGTPPMQIQPLFREYEYADLQKGYNTAKQHNVARKVTSYTSPFGDRTQSFRHGPPALNKHTVLPPIGASQPPGNDFVSNLPSVRELRNSQENMDGAVALETLIAQKFKNYPVHKISINDMYIELSSFDRDLTGYVSENQLGLVVLRHDLPFKLSTLKMIYKKFSDPRDPRMVNYEKFLQFLLSCMSQSKSDEFSAERSRSSERAISKNGASTNRQSTAKEGITDILMSCPVDGKFVTLIKEQLSGSDDWDLVHLYTTLHHSDRLHNHQLHADVIMRACVSERVPLTSSILTSMLQQAEIDHGKVDWRQFLAPLVCAYIQLYPNRNIVDTSMDSRPHGSQLKEIESRSSTNGFQSELRSGRNTDVPSSTKVAPKDHLSAGWDEREPRGSKNPLLNSVSPGKTEEGPRHDDLWMRNFTRLSHALRSYHPHKSNRLPRSEVERMVNNYNLIYGLGFQPGQLTSAVERSVVEKSSEGKHADIISVDRLLDSLLGN